MDIREDVSAQAIRIYECLETPPTCVIASPDTIFLMKLDPTGAFLPFHGEGNAYMGLKVIPVKGTDILQVH